MPNVGHPDYVAVHKHSASDLQGAQALLFPPTTIASFTIDVLLVHGVDTLMQDMDVTVEAPASWPIWEVLVVWTGEVVNTNAGGTITVTPYYDGVADTDFARAFGVKEDGHSGVLQLQDNSRLLAAGDSLQIELYWSIPDGAATATNGRLEVTLRPHCPAVM